MKKKLTVLAAALTLILCIMLGVGMVPSSLHQAPSGTGLMEFGEAGASVESNNEKLLALLIYSEGEGLIYRDKVSLGAIVLNRVRAPEYPKTIAGVIFQLGAFERLMRSRFRSEPDKEARNAARDALDGFDPTGGAVEYQITNKRLVANTPSY